MTNEPITKLASNALGLLSPDELAVLLGVTVRTLQRWALERTGPPITKIGRQSYYRAQSVQSWLESVEQRPRKR